MEGESARGADQVAPLSLETCRTVCGLAQVGQLGSGSPVRDTPEADVVRPGGVDVAGAVGGDGRLPVVAVLEAEADRGGERGSPCGGGGHGGHER